MQLKLNQQVKLEMAKNNKLEQIKQIKIEFKINKNNLKLNLLII